MPGDLTDLISLLGVLIAAGKLTFDIVRWWLDHRRNTRPKDPSPPPAPEVQLEEHNAPQPHDQQRADDKTATETTDKPPPSGEDSGSAV